jgi:hypothetical protein
VVATPAHALSFTVNDLMGVLSRLETEEFPATPTEMCRYCDFLRFCDAGRSFVAMAAAPDA